MSGRGLAKILEISSYPPPRAGWGVRIAFVRKHLEASGHFCQVLNIGPSRRIRSPEYEDVRNGVDLVRKLVRYAFNGYLLHAHVNGDSPKGLAIALLAETVGLLSRRRGVLTFHAGPEQRFFPGHRSRLLAPFFRAVFVLPRTIICNSEAVRASITTYGVRNDKIVVIPAFSEQYLGYEPRAVPAEVERLSARYGRLIAAYFFHRPEFFVESMMDGLRELASADRRWALVLIGGDARSAAITRLVERAGLSERTYQAGDLGHDEFMSVLSRVHVFVRTPKKDGVCSSVLEALSLGVPVVASENGSRPPGVVTFRPNDGADLAEKLRYVLSHYEACRSRIGRPAVRDTVKEEADLLVALSAGRGDR